MIATIFFFFQALLTIFFFPLYSTSPFPVDVTYFMADLKYSKEHGVKICEIQNGVFSSTEGDLYLYGINGSIALNAAHRLAEIPLKKWMLPSTILCKTLVNNLQATGWNAADSLERLLADPDFLEHAKRAPEEPFSIQSYSGILFCSHQLVHNQDFHQKYPGILVMDAVSYFYQMDKMVMSQPFNSHEELKKMKPEWNHYPKKYTPDLAEHILREIPGDLLVIKPRGTRLGNGVIIIKKEELDETLRSILNNPLLKRHPDIAYRYWTRDKSDSFIVEKFYHSDSVRVPSLSPDPYDSTMRIGFLLIYDHQNIEVVFCGGYWMLPKKPLNSTGTLGEKFQSYGRVPYHQFVAEDVLEEIEKQLKSMMPLFYKAMLEPLIAP